MAGGKSSKAPRRYSRAKALKPNAKLLDPGGKTIFRVDRVVGKRVDKRGRTLYLVKNEDYDDSESTWEPDDNVADDVLERRKRENGRLEDSDDEGINVENQGEEDELESFDGDGGEHEDGAGDAGDDFERDYEAADNDDVQMMDIVQDQPDTDSLVEPLQGDSDENASEPGVDIEGPTSYRRPTTQQMINGRHIDQTPTIVREATYPSGSRLVHIVYKPTGLGIQWWYPPFYAHVRALRVWEAKETQPYRIHRVVGETEKAFILTMHASGDFIAVNRGYVPAQLVDDWHVLLAELAGFWTRIKIPKSASSTNVWKALEERFDIASLNVYPTRVLAASRNEEYDGPDAAGEIDEENLTDEVKENYEICKEIERRLHFPQRKEMSVNLVMQE